MYNFCTLAVFFCNYYKFESLFSMLSPYKCGIIFGITKEGY